MREIQGQCLRLVNNDKISIYEELTDKAGLVFIHQRNIWGLVVVLFKIKNGGLSKLGSFFFFSIGRSSVNHNTKTKQFINSPRTT